MTAKELLAKNAAIRLQRKQAQQKATQEVAESCDECSLVREELEQKQTSKKRRGKKPAAREYMVVEDDSIKEEEDSE